MRRLLTKLGAIGVVAGAGAASAHATPIGDIPGATAVRVWDVEGVTIDFCTGTLLTGRETFRP